MTHLARLPTVAKLLAWITACVAVVFAVAAPVAAQGATCTVNGQPGISVSIAINGQHCIPIGGSTAQTSGIFFVLIAVVQFLATGVGLAVVAGIIYGGFTYITARGNAGQTEKGRDIVAGAVVALLLFIFMVAILNFVIGRNVFS